MMDNLLTYAIYPLNSNLIVNIHCLLTELLIYTLIKDSVPKKSNCYKSIKDVYVS